MSIARAIPADAERDAPGLLSETREAALSKVFWVALALSALAAVPAILSAQGLVYDGAYYLLGVAAHGQFQLWEPARHSVQFLQQIFAFVGGKLGIHDVWTLGILFSLATAGWPIVIAALCWFVLPRGQKSWIAGPLLNLVFAIPSTSFIGIGEGIIASCLLWLAFLLVAFRMGKPTGALAAVVAVGVCTVVHESAALCLVAIGFAAVLQIRRTTGFCRASAVVAAILAFAGAAYMLRWIVFPRSTIERGDFLSGLLGGFVGTAGAPNVPALASLLAGVAMVIAPIRERLARWVVAIAVLGLVCQVAFLWLAPDEAISPSRYFAARGLPVALTTVLMLAFLYLGRSGRTPVHFATGPVLAIVLSLAAAQAAGQLAIARAWTGYVQGLRALVSSESGTIRHAAAMAALDSRGGRFRREMLEHWSAEPLSILLAPGGHVRAVVQPAPTARWIPYDPHDRAKLPRAPGLDWSRFYARP
ncbi:MAG TPA: hypothetical protein VGL35_03980 [Rhizomicrobium sp.]|jgi:hypothetical protein